VAAIPLYWFVVQNLVAADIAGLADNAKNIHRTRWLTRQAQN